MSLTFIENGLQAVVSGLLIGSIYGLMCVGLSLIFGIMRVTNFAQGEFLMLGMYATWWLFGSAGIGDWLGPAVGSVVCMLLAGILVFVVGAFVPGVLGHGGGRGRSGDHEGNHTRQLLVTLGLSLVLSNGALILFGSESRTLRTPLSSSAWEIGPFVGDALSVFVTKAHALGCVVALLLAGLTQSFVTRTRTGKQLRAAAANIDAAVYMGIDVSRAHRIAFGLGVALTAVAGGIVATYYPFQPYVGIDFVIVMFAGVVLGGLGSVAGAFWGGLIIGAIQQLSTLVLPGQLANTAIFATFLAIVMWRPQGLFGRSAERM